MDRVANLTIDEFKQLIRQTVQEAVAEVLVEFSIAAEHDADIVNQAEITDWLRMTIREQLDDLTDHKKLPLSDD